MFRKKGGSLLILLLVVSLMLAGCGGQKAGNGETPEEAVINALNAVKTLNLEAMQKYFAYEDLMGELESDELVDNKDSSKLIFSKLSFKIISSSIVGTSATVKAEITNIDMLEVLTNYLQEVFVLAFSNDFSEEPLNEEELEAIMEQLFIDILNDESKMVTSTVDIKVTKHESSWQIEVDEPFQDAVMGGMLTAIKELELEE